MKAHLNHERMEITPLHSFKRLNHAQIESHGMLHPVFIHEVYDLLSPNDNINNLLLWNKGTLKFRDHIRQHQFHPICNGFRDNLL